LIGIGLGQQLHQFGVTDEVSLTRILRGIRDGLAGKKVQPEDQVRLQTLLRSISEAAAAKNAAAAKQFLERNAKVKGVVTTTSGLQYKIVAAGDAGAASPQLSDQVTVQYRGTLLDGTEFDVPGQGRHQGLAGGVAAHEARREVAIVHSAGTGLRPGTAAADPRQLAAEVRGRTRERETCAAAAAAARRDAAGSIARSKPRAAHAAHAAHAADAADAARVADAARGRNALRR
jgi:hypothetical protein